MDGWMGRAICSAIHPISVIAKELPFRLPAIHPLRECDAIEQQVREMRLHFAPPLSSHFQCHSCPDWLSVSPTPPRDKRRCLRAASCLRSSSFPSRLALQMGISRSSLTLRLRVRTCAAAAIPPTDLPSRSRCRRRRLLPKSDPRSRRSVDLNLSGRVTGTALCSSRARLLASSTFGPTSPRFISHSDTEGVTGTGRHGGARLGSTLRLCGYEMEMDKSNDIEENSIQARFCPQSNYSRRLLLLYPLSKLVGNLWKVGRRKYNFISIRRPILTDKRVEGGMDEGSGFHRAPHRPHPHSG